MTDQPANAPNTTPTHEDAMPVDMLKARFDACPLRDCKGDQDDGYYIRDVRNNRHLCQHCAVPSPTGYIGRDTAKQMDDRYFLATPRDYAITFGVMLGGSIVANVITFFVGGFVGFFGLIIAFLVGNIAGTWVARQARELTGRRVGRQSAEIAVAGAIVGMLIAPSVYILLRAGVFIFSLQLALQLMPIVCTGAMSYFAWGIFKRRI